MKRFLSECWNLVRPIIPPPAPVSGTPTKHGLYRENLVNARLHCDVSGNINDSFNISGITDTGTGVVTVTLDRDYASTYYSIAPGVGIASFARSVIWNNQAVGSFTLECFNDAGGASDPSYYTVICSGDQ